MDSAKKSISDFASNLMKLGIIQANEDRANAPARKPSVVVSANPQRERVLLDSDGNQINNFKQKQIISKAEQN